jgi:hypothetical protein
LNSFDRAQRRELRHPPKGRISAPFTFVDAGAAIRGDALEGHASIRLASTDFATWERAPPGNGTSDGGCHQKQDGHVAHQRDPSEPVAVK